MDQENYKNKHRSLVKKISKDLEILEEIEDKIDSFRPIKFPKGNIRTANGIRNNYSLSKYIKDENLKKNISYSFQMNDFLRYVRKRFNIDLSLGQYLLKYELINLFCIFEALIYGAIENLNSKCKVDKYCKKSTVCKYYISRYGNNSIKKNIEKLFEILDINESELNIDEILELKKLRDNIHIFNAEKNEFTEVRYSRLRIFKMEEMIKRLTKLICKRLNRFNKKRLIDCELFKIDNLKFKLMKDPTFIGESEFSIIFN